MLGTVTSVHTCSPTNRYKYSYQRDLESLVNLSSGDVFNFLGHSALQYSFQMA
jgi:hypothetical protein